MKIRKYLAAFLLIGFCFFSINSFALPSCPQDLSDAIVTKDPDLADKGYNWRLLNGVEIPGQKIVESGFIFFSEKKINASDTQKLIRGLVFNKQSTEGGCYYTYAEKPEKFHAAYVLPN